MIHVIDYNALKGNHGIYLDHHEQFGCDMLDTRQTHRKENNIGFFDFKSHETLFHQLNEDNIYLDTIKLNDTIRH